MHRYKVLERTFSIHVLLNTQMQHQLCQAKEHNILLGKYKSIQEGKESLSPSFKEHEIMNKELSSLSPVQARNETRSTCFTPFLNSRSSHL